MRDRSEYQRELTRGLHSWPQISGSCFAVSMSTYTRQVQDMASYVGLSGTPHTGHCAVFGLTPSELRYLKVGEQNI